jgi:signal transduction histidine kinase
VGFSPLRTLCLAIVAPLVCFVVGSVYVLRWSAQIETAAWSIAVNGGPGVVYLSAAREDIRRIEQRAMGVQPTSIEEDRTALTALRAEFDRNLAEYRKTPDYPGEHLAWEVMLDRTEPFFSAVDAVLASANEGPIAREAAGVRVEATSEALVAATVDLVSLNARGIEGDAATIAALRQRAFLLTNARDALAFAFVVVGTWMSFRGARQSAAIAAERHRHDAERLAEMELFSGRVAHDLRDPLAAIVMRCARADRLDDVADARDALVRIASQARRMGVTIDALLAFARTAARPAPGARSETAAVIRDLVATVEPLAAEARLEVVVEPLASTTVACDPGVLGVILANLVGNAVKYAADTSRPLRRVTLRAHREGPSLRFEVEDTGPGLPPGTEAQVFEPFVRAHHPSAGKSGIGLGLATVKRFVEANGGKVGVDSHPGLGCCFWFTLPLASPAPREAVA